MEPSTEKLTGADGRDLASLITLLGHEDWHRRQQARLAIEEIGSEATPALIDRLNDEDQNVRWEAAKALGTIRDPRAGRPLARALMDKSFEVQWLAAEALISLGEDGIVPILQELLAHPDSVALRQGAHHVLHHRERHGQLDDSVIAVIDDIRSIERQQPYLLSARQALEAMGVKPERTA